VRRVLALALLLLAGCEIGCGIGDDVTSAVSPNRRLKAVRYVRWCDPDGQHFTHISIVGRWGPISGAGNAFSCDAEPDEVRMLWEGDGRLRVSYPGTAQVVRRVTPVEGVTIDYVARAPGLR